MSFAKAEQLIELATLASRFMGVTLDDVVDRFRGSKRTAQRMLRALESRFPNAEIYFDNEGRKRWRLKPDLLRELLTVLPEELAALDLALELLVKAGQDTDAAKLQDLRGKILALIPRQRAARIETDHEALLEAQGLAARPGPRPRINHEIAAAISEAIKFTYRSRSDKAARDRMIMPYGILVGLRRYAVARTLEDPKGPMRMYRFEDIKKAELTDRSFEREASFRIREFAKRAFGAFQNEKEYGEVIWRFHPSAAAHAREFEFHPDQVMQEQKDGSLLVRFSAAGHLEMCWHLYAWGDKVDVLKPERLRKMTELYRRSDFPALP
jgi:predicted DNA-binding transcriptional regulator YafY